MKKIYREGSPAFLAAVLFIVVEGINILDIISSPKHFEIFSNAIMIIIAIYGFLCIGIPAKNSGVGNLISILSNVAVSAIAFPMNIDVFKHVIHPDQILSDLWGWHTWWIFCAIVQILVLSRLGENLLELVEELLAGGKKAIKSFGDSISTLKKQIEEEIEKSDKGVVITILIGFIIWAIYFGAWIWDRGIYIALADKNFWWGSIKLWVGCIAICFLISIASPLLKKMKEAIKNMESKSLFLFALFAVMTIIIFYTSSILQGGLGELLKILIYILSISLICVRALKEWKKKSESNCKEYDGDRMSPIDKVFYAAVFYVIPLSIVFLLALFFYGGEEIINTNDLSDFTTWVELWGTVLNAVNDLLK
ncbi:MAG: hypothetical protein NC543_04920 [bacterium]|nr:hypothetical protein [bacterium]MCM1374881.1 hypothetical protein [Muribaculum sp.]